MLWLSPVVSYETMGSTMTISLTTIVSERIDLGSKTTRKLSISKTFALKPSGAPTTSPPSSMMPVRGRKWVEPIVIGVPIAAGPAALAPLRTAKPSPNWTKSSNAATRRMRMTTILRNTCRRFRGVEAVFSVFMGNS